MIDEIHYRVVRGILSSRANTEVQQVNINLDDLSSASISAETGGHPLLRQNRKEGEE